MSEIITFKSAELQHQYGVFFYGSTLLIQDWTESKEKSIVLFVSAQVASLFVHMWGLTPFTLEDVNF